MAQYNYLRSKDCRSSSLKPTKLQQYVNNAFDILTASISVLDLITDIIVAVQYYTEAQYQFFIPCCLIIIAAQLTYCTMFIYRYRLPKQEQSSIKTSLIFIALIPISPLLSFVFYFASTENSKLTILLKTYLNLEIHTIDDFDIDESEKQNEPKWIKWMKKKIGSHMGFIAEAVIESLPQSIIQMTAMIIYNTPNYFSIISILLSLISISMKSFVICIASAIDSLTIIFCWLCIVTDFIGIFTVISWIFYTPSTSTHHTNVLFQIWFYKVSIFIIPSISFICLSGFVLIILNYLRDKKRYKTNFLFVFIFLLFCIPLLSLLIEMLCWSLIAFIIFINGEMKWKPWDPNIDSQTLRKIFIFIQYKHYDDDRIDNDIDSNWRIRRICCANYVFINNKYTSSVLEDDVMKEFLENEISRDCLSSVTYNDIRNNISTDTTHKSKIENVSYIKILWLYYTDGCNWANDIKDNVMEGRLPCNRYYTDEEHLEEHTRFYWMRWLLLWIWHFIVIPWALFSKLISFLFPFIMICFIGSVGVLQRYMFFIYFVLGIIVMVLMVFVVRFHYWIWHLVPNTHYGGLGVFVFEREEMMEIYDDIVVNYESFNERLVIENIILGKFGKNIGELVLSWFFDKLLFDTDFNAV